MPEMPIGPEQIITLTEFTAARVRLTPDELNHLLTVAGRARLSIQPSASPEVYELKPAQFVGMLPLPGGRTLHIQPKVPVSSLFAMLNGTIDLAFYLPDKGAHSTYEHVIEAVIEAFITVAERAIEHRLLRSIETVEQEDTTIRGRINMSAAMRQATSLRHVSEAPNVTADNAENRLLKLACHLLIPISRFRSRASRILDQLRDVPLDEHAALIPIIITRRNHHYAAAIDLARQITDGQFVTGAPGSTSFAGFLIDMNRLFERFMIAVLRSLPAVTVEVQPTLPMDVTAELTIRPDAVITTAGSQRIPVDAKYKTESLNSDMYQLMAYCHILDSPRGLLVYPQITPDRKRSSLRTFRLPRLSSGIETVIDVLALDLSSDDTIQQASSQFTILMGAWR